MNTKHLYAALLVCAGAVATLAGADPAGAPAHGWRSLLQKDSAPDWRGWKLSLIHI